jgi:hypothetical protein
MWQGSIFNLRKADRKISCHILIYSILVSQPSSKGVYEYMDYFGGFIYSVFRFGISILLDKNTKRETTTSIFEYMTIYSPTKQALI